jgi:hypothetical protein
MKKYTLMFTMALLLALNAFGQQAAPEESMTGDEYLKISQKQKRKARTLLCIGTTAMVSGLLISVGNNDDLDGQLATSFTGIPLLVIGGILNLASTTVFHKSRENERRAQEAVTSLKAESGPLLAGDIIRQ